MRKTFIRTLVKIAEKDPRIVLITPDIGYSVLEEFRDAYPDRFFNVGIAEQNSVSIAAGMALNGFIPYVYTINPFVTMRPFEQIRVDVAYMNTNVRLVGVGAGFSYGAAGATHHSIEDIAILRALPNMTVVCPGDPWEVEQAVLQSASYQGPLFLRLGKQGEPVINDTSGSFTIGRGIELIKGSEVAIVTTSNTLEICRDVCKRLNDSGTSAGLISMHTVKPLDKALLLDVMSRYTHMFSVEEHNIIGGLGSAISEVIAETGLLKGRFKRIGVEDSYSHYVGGHEFIRRKFGIDRDSIFETISSVIGH